MVEWAADLISPWAARCGAAADSIPGDFTMADRAKAWVWHGLVIGDKSTMAPPSIPFSVLCELLANRGLGFPDRAVPPKEDKLHLFAQLVAIFLTGDLTVMAARMSPRSTTDASLVTGDVLSISFVADPAVRAVAVDSVRGIARELPDVFRALVLVCVELATLATSADYLTIVCTSNNVASQKNAFQGACSLAHLWQQIAHHATNTEHTRDAAVKTIVADTKANISTCDGLLDASNTISTKLSTIKRNFTARRPTLPSATSGRPPLCAEANLTISCTRGVLGLLQLAVQHPSPQGLLQSVFGVKASHSMPLKMYKHVLDAACCAITVCGRHTLCLISHVDIERVSTYMYDRCITPAGTVAMCRQCGLVSGYPAKEKPMVTPGPNHRVICSQCLSSAHMHDVNLSRIALIISGSGGGSSSKKSSPKSPSAGHKMYTACCRCGVIAVISDTTMRWDTALMGLVCKSPTCAPPTIKSSLYTPDNTASIGARSCKISRCMYTIARRKRSQPDVSRFVVLSPGGGGVTPITLCASCAATARAAAGHRFILPAELFAPRHDNPSPTAPKRKRPATMDSVLKKRRCSGAHK